MPRVITIFNLYIKMMRRGYQARYAVSGPDALLDRIQYQREYVTSSTGSKRRYSSVFG